VCGLLLDKGTTAPPPSLFARTLRANLSGGSDALVLALALALAHSGADASAKTNDGSCPLHYFVRMDPKNVTEFHKVLERMAVGDSPVERARTVNTQNRHGESPLHHAAIKGREHVRTRPRPHPLLGRFYFILTSTHDHRRPCCSSTTWVQTSTYVASRLSPCLATVAAPCRLRFCAENTAVPLSLSPPPLHMNGLQLKNKYGESSLVVAIRSARADMVRLLLSLGGDPRQESDAGAPLDLARYRRVVCRVVCVFTQPLILGPLSFFYSGARATRKSSMPSRSS
jgi:ankyrin repeat protein